MALSFVTDTFHVVAGFVLVVPSPKWCFHACHLTLMIDDLIFTENVLMFQCRLYWHRFLLTSVVSFQDPESCGCICCCLLLSSTSSSVSLGQYFVVFCACHLWADNVVYLLELASNCILLGVPSSVASGFDWVSSKAMFMFVLVTWWNLFNHLSGLTPDGFFIILTIFYFRNN